MLFKKDLLTRIATGEVTLAFRRWKRPTVRAGGTLRTAVGVLAIDRIEPVAPADIGREDAERAGFPTRDALLADLGDGDGTLYRIAFHRAGDDPRAALRKAADIDEDERARIETRLAGFDARSARPWALATLRLIAAHEGLPAAGIAQHVGLDKPDLKRKIRKLKELGLTESLEVGYRLSPRGRAFLSMTEHR